MSCIHLWGEKLPPYSQSWVQSHHGLAAVKGSGKCIATAQHTTGQGLYTVPVFVPRKGLSEAPAQGLVSHSEWSRSPGSDLSHRSRTPSVWGMGQDRWRPREEYKKQDCQLKVDTQN